MRIAALVLSLCAATSWGIGGVLLKRGTDVVTPTTILVFQYAIGAALVTVWLLGTSGIGGLGQSIERSWLTLLVLALFQIAGYIFFVVAVQKAGEGSLPTAVAIAISASYPALVVVLSGTFLDEPLQWNHALGVLLVVGGVILALAL